MRSSSLVSRPITGQILRPFLVAAMLTLSLVPVHPAEEQAASERPALEVGHKEDAVAPPEVPVARDSQPRSPAPPIFRGQAQSVQVNVDSQNDNIVGDAANEPSMAVDPTDPNNIVIGWRQFDTIADNFRQAGMAYSHDGGATWTFPGVLDPGQFRSDPVLAVDSQGNFYYYSLSSVTTTEYFISTDKGVSWSAPTYSPGGDKNWQTVDATGGTGDGHVYPIWNSQFTCCDPGTDFSRSTNGAITFEGPYVLPQKPKWGTNDVGPDGELYIVGTTLDSQGHLLFRSDDADNAAAIPTFNLQTSIDLGGTSGSGGAPNPGGLLGQVWVAVDRSTGATRGNVYVLASVNPPGTDPLDVHFIRSEDGGQTWSAPLRVNDDPGNGAYQWFGTMSVAPNGRIDVVWNDTRSGPATISELYYAYSNDAGVTFSAGLPVSPAFDSTIGHPSQNKIGDYYHMVSDVAGAGLAYSATFNGEQDVYFLRVGDCNANGTHDSVDLSGMTSQDVNSNGVPDECEPDCNANGVPDDSDVNGGTSDDCNANAVPDECDIAGGTSEDCNGNLVLDECDIALDLEAPQGFTVGAAGDTATTGVWERVDPVGTDAQPEDDHTPGGTDCFVTGQGLVGGALGDNDVDGGATTLFSPVFDLSAFTEPWVGYWRWYSNNTGGEPNADTFVIDISNDGGEEWSNVEVVGPAGADAGGRWTYHSFRVSEILPPTSGVQLRFVAADLEGGSVVEAAIDDIVLLDCSICTSLPPAEVNNLLLGRSGTVANLSWNTSIVAEAYNLYRGAQSDATDLACYLSSISGTSVMDDGLVPPAGGVSFHVLTAANCAGESPLGSDRSATDPCP